MNNPIRAGIEYPSFMYCGNVRFEGSDNSVSLFEKNGVKFVITTDRNYIYTEDIAEGIVVKSEDQTEHWKR